MNHPGFGLSSNKGCLIAIVQSSMPGNSPDSRLDTSSPEVASEISSASQGRRATDMTGLQESRNTVRRRKWHRKSRSGCANCKLRRVKVCPSPLLHGLPRRVAFNCSSGSPWSSVTRNTQSAVDAGLSVSFVTMTSGFLTFSLDMRQARSSMTKCRRLGPQFPTSHPSMERTCS